MTGIENNLYLIVNPYARRGASAASIALALRLLDEANIPYQMTKTTHRGHAMSLTQSFVREHPNATVVAVGGDGTVNEVLNGLAGSNANLALIPVGSGNDFAKTVGLSPDDVRNAVDTIIRGNVIPIDIGEISILDAGGQVVSKRYFGNGIGIGFDGYIAYYTQRFKRLRGWWLYLAAVLRTFIAFRTPELDIKFPSKEIHSPHLLVAIGNGHCAGGNFFLTPQATVTDGLFDICLVDRLGAFKLLRVLPTVFSGSHGKYKEVHFFRSKMVSITGKSGLYVHADGEIVAEGQYQKFHLQLHEKLLHVIADATFQPKHQIQLPIV